MSKVYQVTPIVRLVNRILRWLIDSNLAPPHAYLLTVRGRKSGKTYTTPVTLVEENGKQWLVSPYGQVQWVHNARAAGQVTLTRGRQSETRNIIELEPAERVPILKKYLVLASITRPYFAILPDAPGDQFVAEAARHPIFLLQ